MIDSRRKLLTEALGEKWHEPYELHEWSDDCGMNWYTSDPPDYPVLKGIRTIKPHNRTFATADDYEALRKIVPNLQRFTFYIFKVMENEGPKRDLAWWLTLTPEERCELICDFGIACLGWEVKK